jgi:predicted O-linked N-acetylglucosamine transferase (SPINDLY family)
MPSGVDPSHPETDHAVLFLERGIRAIRENIPEKAVPFLQQAHDLAPQWDEPRHYLGVAAMLLGNLRHARDWMEQSLKMSPAKGEYHLNYGRLILRLGNKTEAVKIFRRATELSPDSADAWQMYGKWKMLTQGPNACAEKALRRCLALAPRRIEALYYLAQGFMRKGEYGKARQYWEDLHAIDPANLQYLARLTEACEKDHQLEQAIVYAQQAARLAPEHARIQHDLGRLFGRLGEVNLAKFHFRQGALRPRGCLEWKWKYLGFCPSVFESEEQIEAYWDRLNRDLDTAIAERPIYSWRQVIHQGFVPPFQLPHLNRLCREVKEKFVTLFQRSFDKIPCDPLSRKSTCKKIRVGFLVTPGHEGGFLRLTRPIIERLDGERFQPVLIHHVRSRPRLAKDFQPSDQERVMFDSDFASAVERIRQTRCDILYYWKVGADAWSFFLPMIRLAPVQCTSWSTHGTSGQNLIDYYISWDRAEPDGARNHYTESLFPIGRSPLFEPRLPCRATPRRTELALPEKGAIYFCPHRPEKYHPMFDDYLEEILARDSEGHIVLLTGSDHGSAQLLKKRLRAKLEPSLVARLIFLPKQPLESYHRYLSVATAILNSPVYSGEITSIDGFLYGVPSVTQTGPFLVQRYTTAFYDFLEVPHFAQSDRNGYVDLAVRLGTDPDFREHHSSIIRERSEQLFESSETVRAWESFFEEAMASRS